MTSLSIQSPNCKISISSWRHHQLRGDDSCPKKNTLTWFWHISIYKCTIISPPLESVFAAPPCNKLVYRCFFYSESSFTICKTQTSATQAKLLLGFITCARIRVIVNFDFRFLNPFSWKRFSLLFLVNIFLFNKGHKIGDFLLSTYQSQQKIQN